MMEVVNFNLFLNHLDLCSVAKQIYYLKNPRPKWGYRKEVTRHDDLPLEWMVFLQQFIP